MAKWRMLQAGALMLALAAVTTPGNAAPLSALTTPDAAKAVQSVDVTPAQFRGRSFGRGPIGRGGYAFRGRGYGRGYGYRPFVGFGVGAAIVAGAILANRAYAPRPGYYYDTYAYDGPYYYPQDYRGDPRDICARHFRSFEWDTGLYTTYQGEKRLCPYLG